MEQLTRADLQLVLDAARQHYRNDQHWRPVNGPAYFEENLKRAENRTKLGEAINRLEKSEIMTSDIMYRITRGRWDVPMRVYEEFEATSDDDAKNTFKQISERKENEWDTMFLYRVDQTEKTTLLAKVRV